ncbi:MAG: hypothetical protein GC164_07740 [Phycisphaera sp.]|nr:hypothetical protein [Phycisphaera sp.]
MNIRNHCSTAQFLTALLICISALPASAGNPVPAVIPKPDGRAPAKDKPVKIYIFSGQSNSFGMGAAEGGHLHYSSIVLSPDPHVKTTKMPVGTSGLLPMRVYTDAQGKQPGATAWVVEGHPDADVEITPTGQGQPIALGDVTATLPSADKPHTVVVKGFIEVPITGMHEVHPGFGESEFAVVTINGKEAYRKTSDEPATLTRVKLESGKRHPITIHYLKGGQAAFWMELVDLKPRGSLRYMIEEKGMFPNLLDENGQWIVRDDAHVNNTYMGQGKDAPFSPMWRGGTFGPEVGFGNVIATYHDEPVILMKVDIGNRSLGWDILPPGSKAYEVDGKKYPGYGETPETAGTGTHPEGAWYAGKQYDDYTASIHHVLDHFAEIYPQYADQGYEIAGFVWWQGHKDQNPVHASRYAQNFANLVKAWRKEFNCPDAKWVLATIAFGGWDLDGPGKMVAEAQLSVDGDAGVFPEHKGNVKTIEARDFWREPGESPMNQDYHYNHNGETYFLVGDALGRAMVELQGGKAEPRQDPPRPERPEHWPKDPTLEQAAQMLYTNEFLSPWLQGEAEPTPEEMEAMAPAIKPYVMGKLLPEYIDAAPTVPAYRRSGASIVPLVTGEPPDKVGASLPSQLDVIIDYYNAIGIHDYDWKKFGPDMQQGLWHYYSFTPTEPADTKSHIQYRQVQMPEGMAEWYTMAFDPEKADWKIGQAPFGQNNGEKKALRGKCNNPQCGCDVTPNTYWENDLLLIRQTFDIPKLKENHRYRLVVGGGNHAWAGEGFAVYINGKLFAEEQSAKFKNGGISGRYFYNDFLPDLESGKITVAVKSFLRRSQQRGNPAPPSGHLSVWLEEAKLPDRVLESIK